VATTSPRTEWLTDLREPVLALLRDAESYVAFISVRPPTERAFSDALNAIRVARRRLREERRQTRQGNA
jgi:hypothetical protein